MLIIVVVCVGVMCWGLSRSKVDNVYPSICEVDKADNRQLIDWIFKLPDARNVDEEQIQQRIYARYKKIIENEM